MNKYLSLYITTILTLSGCVSVSGPTSQVDLVQGPPVVAIETPFDVALECLSGRISPKITFSVGAIADSTGKEQFTEGGTGKFITQGAGEIVQTALFNAGALVVNRRDPRVLEAEVKWGIRGSKSIVPSKYFVTGSINSLDFIPGAGFDAQIAGIGPRYRQNRILVGLDLSITDTSTGKIVANSSMQKQIFADELGLGIGRFFGNTLVNVDAANLRREATGLALRQMLNLATFDLLTQLMKPKNYVDCTETIKDYHQVKLSKTWRSSKSTDLNDEKHPPEASKGDDGHDNNKNGHHSSGKESEVNNILNNEEVNIKAFEPQTGSPETEVKIKTFDSR